MDTWNVFWLALFGGALFLLHGFGMLDEFRDDREDLRSSIQELREDVRSLEPEMRRSLPRRDPERP